MASKTKTTKVAKAKTPKLFYAYGDVVWDGDSVWSSLEELVDQQGIDSGEKVTILQVVGVKTLNVSTPSLV